MRKNAYQRKFQGLPVRDAKGSIRVQPNREDIKSATRGDPTCCAYAQCLKRQWSTERVWVFSRTAYVQVLDAKGKPLIERYTINGDAWNYLNNFDSGNGIDPAGFVLQAPTGWRTLDAIARHDKETRTARIQRNKKRRDEAKIKGTKAKPAPTPRELTAISRSGRGMVHFYAKDEANKIHARAEMKPHHGRATLKG